MTTNRTVDQDRARLFDEKLAELSHLYRTAPVGLCLMDTELRFVRINERLAAINGASVEDHVGRTLREIVPAVADVTEPIYRRVIETGEPAPDFEVQAPTPVRSNGEACLLVRYHPLKSDDGTVVGVSTVVQDITERKAAEQALRINQHNYRRLLETTRAIPWEFDERTERFTYIGPQSLDLLGYPPERWYEREFWTDHIHPEDRREALDYCARMARVQPDYEFEYRMIAADGRVLWVQDIVSVEYEGNEPVILRGFLIDISERKQIEDALRLSEERYRDLYENAPEMFLSVDAASGVVLQCNGAVIAKTGFAREQIVGRHLTELYHPDCLDAVDQALITLREEAELRDIELLVKRKDGGKIRVNLNASAVRDASGQVLYTRSVLSDITELRRAEEQAKASEAALRISEEHLRYLTGRLISAQEEERRRLARELHDDLAQRLAGLAIDTGNLEHLLKDAPQNVRVKLQEMRLRISELSTNVQTISRQLHPSILDDLGLVSAIESECALFSKREGIPVSYEPMNVPESLPREIAVCLYRVTQEGLHNIAKHAAATEARISLSCTEREIRLRVEDAGGGFDPATARAGSGLGVASMKERVRLIKGDFSIQSRPGLGTTIEVRVPITGRNA